MKSTQNSTFFNVVGPWSLRSPGRILSGIVLEILGDGLIVFWNAPDTVREPTFRIQLESWLIVDMDGINHL